MSKFDRVPHWIGTHPVEFIGLVLAILSFLFTPFQGTFGRWIPSLVILLLVVFIWLARRYVLKHSRAYYAIVLTWEEGYKEAVLGEARRFFTEQGIPEARTRPVAEVRPIDAGKWHDLVNQVIDKLNEVKQSYREIHLVSQAPWLWNFALGSQIQDRYPAVLYHFQGGTYHRIWTISREIKQRASRSGFTYAVCEAPQQVRDGSRFDAAIVVLAVSPRDPSDAILTYADENLPDVPAWIVRREGDLDPDDPQQWASAAAELTHTIESESRAGTKELYLFGIVPDTLGLMVGSSLGPYRKIHLMQYVEGTYKEMLQLPLKSS